MKLFLQATKGAALVSGAVLGFAMPTVESLAQAAGLSQEAQRLALVVGLFLLFFGPVLIFVVGTEHLGLDSTSIPRRVYWASVRNVALRAVFWLLGGAVGFALLEAAQALFS